MGKHTTLPAQELLELLLADVLNIGYVIRANRIEIVDSTQANVIQMYDVSSIIPAEFDGDQHQILLKLVSDFVLKEIDLKVSIV